MKSFLEDYGLIIVAVIVVLAYHLRIKLLGIASRQEIEGYAL